MIRWIINWRHNLFVAMLILLALSSLCSQTKELCLGWGIEQQRLRDSSIQIIEGSVIIPAWYTRFQSKFKSLKMLKMEPLLIIVGYHILVFLGVIWLKMFRWIMCRRIIMEREIQPFWSNWETTIVVGQKSVTIKAGVIIYPGSNRIDLQECKVKNERKQGVEKEVMLPLRPMPMLGYFDPLETEGTSSFSYEESIEKKMRKFYNTLSEKDRRRYAGIEAMKIGHGGIVYIEEVMGCSRKTVSKGIKELNALPSDIGYQRRVRKVGGGRKGYKIKIPDIDKRFFDVIKNNIAGNPMKEGVVWTNLSYRTIAEKLYENNGIKVSTTVIQKLKKAHNYGRRKAQKKTTMKKVKNRNEQFLNIARLKAESENNGIPIISMDTKKKEDIGNFFREGHLYTQKEIITYDHDFKSFAEGVAIPHGIYDITKNTGWISLGTSKDTGEFACDSLKQWWYNQGRYDYPNTRSLIILCDGGGSNSCRHYLFKEDLQKLVDEIGIEIRIPHYPPYTSKYNPIEHRMFPHVTRACQGVIFKSIEIVKEFMEKTKTNKGLKVTVQIIDKVYETGRKVKEGFKENMPIIFDDYLPQWNYRAIPNGKVI